MIHIKREDGLAPVITLTMPNAHLLRLAYVSKLCFWSAAGAQERIYLFERLIDPPWDIIDPPPWRTG